jgi:hypothetical protein
MHRPLNVLATTLVLALPYYALAQCGSAPVAAAACSGGNGAASSGANINGGNTYWFSGGPTTFAGINVSGGTLRVCGTLTLSSISYNSGYIIVENGGKLTINAGFNVSGATIINRGTLTINGSPTFQGSNNFIYNDLSTSVLDINGTITLNGTSSYLINRGMVTATKLIIQGTTGSVCMQDNSILTLTELDNSFTNSISYSGSGAASCLNISTTAFLNNDVTSSGLIHVCTNATPTGGASGDASHGWGSASVTTGCSSCATVLTATGISLDATIRGGQVALRWTTTGQPAGSDVFYVERSLDGEHFSTIAQLDQTATTDPDIIASVQYYRIRSVNSLTGTAVYSSITSITTGIVSPFRVFPNPIGPGQNIHMLLPSRAAGNALLSLTDPAGNTVSERSVNMSPGNNPVSWHPGHLPAGIYFLSIRMPAGNILYSRLVITP